eukprot:556453-Pleurochrysis_carterae.AAC.2
MSSRPVSSEGQVRQWLRGRDVSGVLQTCAVTTGLRCAGALPRLCVEDTRVDHGPATYAPRCQKQRDV